MTMKRTATSKLLDMLAVLVLVLAVAGTAAASITTTAARAASPAEQVRTLERTRLRAVVNADTAAVGRQLAPDFEGINVIGTKATRTGTLASIGGGVDFASIGGGVDFVSITPVTPSRVRLYGNTAAARFQVAFVVVAGPDRVEHCAWFTDLLEKHAGSWQLVWSQTTPIPNDTALFIKALDPHA
jgi:hypothetical protein